MKEYTILAFLSVVITVFLDRKLAINLLKRKEYYLFLAIITMFKFAVNGFLTSTPIVIYSPDYYLGFRIGTIPLEDFFFGFSMVTLAVIFWEYFKKKESA